MQWFVDHGYLQQPVDVARSSTITSSTTRSAYWAASTSNARQEHRSQKLPRWVSRLSPH